MSEIPAVRTIAGEPAAHPKGHAHVRTVLLVGLITLFCLGQSAWAQSQDATANDPPIVAVHYQDLLADEPAFIELYVPPPQIPWTEFSYSAADCLVAQGVHEGAPDQVLVVRFEVPNEGACGGRVDLLFSDGESSWPAAAIVTVNRLPELTPLTDLLTSFRPDRMPMPHTAATASPALVILLSLTNTHPEPLSIVGFGNDSGFVRTVGRVFRYEPANFFGRYDDLIAHGSLFEPSSLAPGETANYAVLIDPQSIMPTGSGTLTVRPVALLELAGQRYTLEFPRISSAWGVELP